MLLLEELASPSRSSSLSKVADTRKIVRLLGPRPGAAERPRTSASTDQFPQGKLVPLMLRLVHRCFPWLPKPERRRIESRRCALHVEQLEERLALSGAGFTWDGTSPLPPTVPVGAGSLTTVLPPGQVGPSMFNPANNAFDGAPVHPNVTSDFSQPVTTSKWWSSLLFRDT